MRPAFIYIELAIATLVLCSVHGSSPPRYDQLEKKARGVLYSCNEDEFIIKELLSHANSYCGNTWNLIAQAHEKEVEANAPGFVITRSAGSLLKRFTRYILENKSVEVPETLKALRDKLKNYRYSPEEEEFINIHLQSIPGALHSDDLWKEMQKRHDAKRLSSCPGFTVKRTSHGLRSHCLQIMERKGTINESIKERFPDHFQTNPVEEKPALTEGSSKTAGARYTPEEDKFIVRTLELYADTYKEDTWNTIAAAHASALKANAPGFWIPRSAGSLKTRFKRYIMENRTIDVSDSVKGIYDNMKNLRYTPQEQDFINKELQSLKGYLYGDNLWKEMQRRHEEKRKAGCAGFTQKRSSNGLRAHYQQIMGRKDLIDIGVKQRFRKYFPAKQGGLCCRRRRRSVGPHTGRPKPDARKFS